MSGGFLSNRDIIATKQHFPRVKFEYSDVLITYSGHHYVHNTPTSHPKWVVTKYTYDANSQITDIEKLEGVWDNRATLDWN